MKLASRFGAVNLVRRDCPLSTHSLPLPHQARCRSVSDDDLCAWCSHLLYRPGELSLCSLSLPESHWPSCCDEDGYTQACPSLRLNNPSQ